MQRRCGKKDNWWCGRFKGLGYKLTFSRQAVLDVLSNTDSHLSAEEIYQRVYKLAPKVGLSSVYRTLELLVEIGLVSKYDFGDRRSRYELGQGIQGDNHHHHLVCTGCGKVLNYTDFIDQELELLKKTEKALSKKYNFRITNHLIQFYGVCRRCSDGKTAGI
ncbi:MAG: transcriptional repressor [Candidatus Omnitrophica bacterium]|nr:transcriptional repressor [Candidatus Omnitrophota bacterium]